MEGGTLLRLQGIQANGKGWRELARETGFSRNTLRKYLRDKHPVEPNPQPSRPSKLDAYKPVIDRWMKEDGLFNCQAMLSRLRKEGYQGGLTLIKDYVKAHRLPRHTKATVRYETKPGQQAQVDWGICTYTDVHGQERKSPVFVMVLGHSRAIYVEYTRRCDIHSFLRCFSHAIDYFGGVPKFMLTDHMKTVVLGMNDDHTPKWNKLFEDFSLLIGLTPKLCRVRRPKTKGKVERGVGYVKDNFWPGRRFSDMADLNRQALAWCEEANQRIHGTTGERPCDGLQEEKLQPVPSPDRLMRFLKEERKVTNDGYVSFDGVRYGVHWTHSGKTVVVRQVGMKVQIWLGDHLLAQHVTSARRGGLVPLKGQYAGLEEAAGQLQAKPMARQIPETKVEQRSLDVYAQLAEVGA